MAVQGAIGMHVPEGRKLESAKPAHEAMVICSLHPATPAIVALARERLQELPAERFGNQQGTTLVDDETNIEYAIPLSYFDPLNPKNVDAFTVRDNRIVPLRERGKDHEQRISQPVGSFPMPSWATPS